MSVATCGNDQSVQSLTPDLAGAHSMPRPLNTARRSRLRASSPHERSDMRVMIGRADPDIASLIRATLHALSQARVTVTVHLIPTHPNKLVHCHRNSMRLLRI